MLSSVCCIDNSDRLCQQGQTHITNPIFAFLDTLSLKRILQICRILVIDHVIQGS